MISASSSDFYKYLDIWDKTLKEQQNLKVKALLDGNGLVFFFTKNGELFGAPEESRISFAKMKHPDEDEDVTKGWVEEATFMAISLDNALKGTKVQNVFSIKDIKNIKVVDKEKAYSILAKKTTDKKLEKNIKTILKVPQQTEPPNMTQLGDDK